MEWLHTLNDYFVRRFEVMREVDRQIMCSNLNNELRQANIDLNAAYLRETNAKNALSTGKGDISRLEWNITQINVELSVMEAGSMFEGRVLSDMPLDL